MYFKTKDIIRVNIKKIHEEKDSIIYFIEKYKLTGHARGIINFSNGVNNTAICRFKNCVLQIPFKYLKLIKSQHNHPLTHIFV